jgi:ribonuclease D
LATPLAPLSAVLGERGPVKIVHDVAFDARMLAECDIDLGNVHDTAVMAQMLGRPATGLASLALSEFGVTLDKSQQTRDWSARPLEATMLSYLATDVTHLEALDDRLRAEAETLGIGDAIAEETRYRLASAIRAVRVPDPRPAYARIKGIEKLGPVDQAIVRRLAETREREAQAIDFPPNELVGNAAILAIAQAHPASVDAVKNIKGAMPRKHAYPIARALVQAVRQGTADGQVPANEMQWLERPLLPPEVARVRRGRESRLIAWRKAQAKERNVNEQAVLPGHCLADLTELEEVDVAHVAAVLGIGAFRVARDGEAIVRVLLTEAPKAG